MRIRTDDQVEIIAGKDAGKQAMVIRTDPTIINAAAIASLLPTELQNPSSLNPSIISFSWASIVSRFN